MSDKRTTADDAVATLDSGMTLGIGGWGSRRKPMSLVRALLRSPVTDLIVVSYGGPDVGLLCAAGKVRKLVYGFVSLDSIPLEPHFRAARQNGTIAECVEHAEGMLQWALYAGALRLPFLQTRAGLGSGVIDVLPSLRTTSAATPSSSGPICTSTTCSSLRATPAGASSRASASCRPSGCSRTISVSMSRSIRCGSIDRWSTA